jgi:hypothetical protein
VLHLPDEILLLVFGFLSRKDLLVCLHTCRRFRAIALDSSFWRSFSFVNKQPVTPAMFAFVQTLQPVCLTFKGCKFTKDFENNMATPALSPKAETLNIITCDMVDWPTLLLDLGKPLRSVRTLDLSWSTLTDQMITAWIPHAPVRLSVLRLKVRMSFIVLIVLVCVVVAL